MKRSKQYISSIIVVVLIAVGSWLGVGENNAELTSSSSSLQANDTPRVISAYEKQQSGVWLQFPATVIKTLPDDNDGSRHQRFLIALDTPKNAQSLTLLVAHNIDLAKRVPLQKGDSLQLRGRYEWNKKGGVLHWTHHDPNKKMTGGWIEHNGQRYS